MNTTTYIGVVNGLDTWEVKNEEGVVVGYNQSAVVDPNSLGSVAEPDSI